MIRVRTAVFISSTALLMVGCGNTTPETGPTTTAMPATSSKPSLAVSVPPAPTQHNNGRQAVTFDPCLEIDDDVVERSGFDPKTRERSDFIFDTYSFIGCSFGHKEQIRAQTLTVRTLTVSATNVSLTEFRNREGKNAAETKVGGRDAIKYDTSSAGSCNVAMASSSGVVNVRTSTNAAFTAERPCDRINEVAAIVESALGDR
ncbi:DUF3558 domain-containing protein [Nocardia brasiliensis]|uniref:DUF3558 domain-containing protein n=1 Tax=Nocardia brasiliensis TaxID=37326 RepID=UPI00366E7D92